MTAFSILDLEVMHDLTRNLDFKEQEGNLTLFRDSRERFAQLLQWTNQFHDRYAQTNWEMRDYLITVDYFFDERFADLVSTGPVVNQ